MADKCEICVVGMIGAKKIPEGLWDVVAAEFDKVIDDWNERKKRFAIKFAYCPMCGRKIEGD